MKKFLTVLIVLAIAAMSVVNCFAADTSTAISDLDLVYYENFSDATKEKYDYNDNYIAEISDQSLYLAAFENKMYSYVIPGSEALSGHDKLTFAIRFKFEFVDNNRALGFVFGGDDNGNGCFVGFNYGMNFVEGEGQGVKAYYSPVVENTLKIEGKTNRRWQYQALNPEASEYYLLDDQNWYTFIFEVEKGKNPTYTFYTGDQLITTYGGQWFGGAGMPDGSDFEFATYSGFTLDGKFGICRTGAGVFVDAVAVYGTTNVDSKEIVAKLAQEGVSAPADTEAPTTEAPVTEAPVTEAPTTEAPVTEAPATEAPVTEAPVTEAPATEAPATDAPTTEAPAKGGCGGVIGLGAIVAILGCAVVLKKREN